MTTVLELCGFLETFAPSALAAEWDNVGLLVGDPMQNVARVMTCLTITPAVAAEGIREQADLIVTHHPLPFKPLQRLTADEPTGRILLDLIRGGIAVHSPHTAFDSAARGINQQLAEGIGLGEIRPLEPAAGMADSLGTGRCGSLAAVQTLGQLAARLKQFLRTSSLQAVGDLQMPIQRVAVACGSAGEFVDVARRQGCQALITGETRLHTCYDAAASGFALLLAGHYASERFGVESLAQELANKYPALEIWASRDERDPLQWL